MKIKYDAQKGNRIKHTFIGMTNFDGYWWIDSLREWRKESNGLDCSSHCDCNSVRAFRRRLKEATKGIDFILVSRWYGQNVYAKSK